MGTIGIIALSLLAGLFIALLIGVGAWLIVLLIAFRRDVHALTTSIHTFTDDTTNLLTLHRSEIRSAFTSQSETWANSINSLSDALTRRHSEWSSEVQKFATILAQHRDSINHAIAQINGQALAEAVKTLIDLTRQQTAIATRNERAATAILTCTREWLSNAAYGDNAEPLTEGVDAATGFAATQPGEPPYVSRSRTARDDEAALREESAEVTQAHEP